MKIQKLGRWVYYFDDNVDLNKDKCGKWMHFFNSNRDSIARICEDAVKYNIVKEAKHSDGEEGVACFYLNYDDIECHKRIIFYFLEKGLIRKTKKGKLYNISFKFDNQTRMGEYGNEFISEITLDKFVDLESGEWIFDKKIVDNPDHLNSALNLYTRLILLVGEQSLEKEKYGSETAKQYITGAFPIHSNVEFSPKSKIPEFWSGNYLPSVIQEKKLLYFVRFKSRFYLLRGKEPFVHCKTSLMYDSRKPLETSDVYNHNDGKYYDCYKSISGKVEQARPILNLVREDFELFKAVYDYCELEILDGCYFDIIT